MSDESTQPEATDAYDAYTRYADSVSIVVTPIDDPGQEDGPVRWIVQSGGAAWDLQWLVREVEGSQFGTAISS